MPRDVEEKCVVCEEVITNPICPECLENEMTYWLAGVRPDAIPVLKAGAGIFKAYTQRGVSCVVCGRNMTVCAYCSCREMYEMLQEHIADVAEDFRETFNFEEVPCIQN